jgi:nucleotide-binding universal stress UspA family protein
MGRNREQERRLLGTHGRLRPGILLATDGSEDAALAARAAADLSNRARVRLHVVHVWQGLRPATLPATAIDPYPRAHQEWEREAGKLLEEQTERLRSAGSTVAGAHLRKGRPAEEIVVLAEELGAGLVAMAATLGAGVSLVRAYPLILDFSEAAKLAEDAALPLQAALRRHELSLEERVRELESELGHSLRVRVREGEAASVILEAAKEGGEPTLVAVGRRGLGRINRLRLGSVSADVLRSAAEPVLIVPAPDGA